MPLVGEFYITRPPPELLRKCFADATATHERRPHRSRSPRLVHTTAITTSSQTVESLLVAIFGTADLPPPLQRSCLKGHREEPAPTHVDLGAPFPSLRCFPDRHRFRNALRGQGRYRDACVREVIVPGPLLPAAERQPTHPLPSICDAAEHAYPLGRLPPTFAERLACGVLVLLSTDEVSCHTAFLCPQCRAQLIRGVSLTLCAGVFGCGVTARQFFAVNRRVDILHRCGAPHTPKTTATRRHRAA
jgi:hypothetical protein